MSAVAAASEPRTWMLYSAKPGTNENRKLIAAAPFTAINLPAAIEFAARRQFDRVRRAHFHLFRLAHEVQHVRNQVRSGFEQDVARVAQHPGVEGAGADWGRKRFHVIVIWSMRPRMPLRRSRRNCS